MAEYLAEAVQAVNLNSPINFSDSRPCRKGFIFHEDGTGVFILRGITNNCFARYQINFGANIAIPEGGTAGPIAIAIAADGEQRTGSRAISTPAAVDQYNYVGSTAIIDVPRGMSRTVSIRAVSGTSDPTATPAPVINVQNANLTISRTA